MSNVNEEATSQKPQIRVSGVLEMLKNGKTRDDIAEHYGITKTAVKSLFQHPELKNKKTIVKKEDPFVLIDDVTISDSPNAPEEPVQEEVLVEESSEGSSEGNAWSRN